MFRRKIYDPIIKMMMKDTYVDERYITYPLSSMYTIYPFPYVDERYLQVIDHLVKALEDNYIG